MVDKGVENHQKSSDVIYGRSQTWVGNFTPCLPISYVPECSSMHLFYTVKANFECIFYITSILIGTKLRSTSLFDIYLLFYLAFYISKKPFHYHNMIGCKNCCNEMRKRVLLDNTKLHDFYIWHDLTYGMKTWMFPK